MSTRSGRPDFLTLTCQRRFGAPGGWRWCSFDADPKAGPRGTMKVVGSVTTTYKTGPKACRPKWALKKDRDVFFVPDAMVKEVELEWEQETGKCHQCGGTSKEWAGWSRSDGDRFRDCARCKATGIAPSAQPVPANKENGGVNG